MERPILATLFDLFGSTGVEKSVLMLYYDVSFLLYVCDD